MRSIKMALLYGLLVWAIPFAVAFLIYPIKTSSPALFESIMPVVIGFCVVASCVLYVRKVKAGFLKEGVLLGIIWLSISLILDLALFMEGPMKMSFVDYMMDIGLAYLLIPTISIGFGLSLQAASRGYHQGGTVEDGQRKDE